MIKKQGRIVVLNTNKEVIVESVWVNINTPSLEKDLYNTLKDLMLMDIAEMVDVSGTRWFLSNPAKNSNLIFKLETQSIDEK